MATIEEPTTEFKSCPCGCGQQLRIVSGRYNYEPERYLDFQTILLACKESGPNVWSLLGTGPWFNDDNRDCWVTLHTWIENKNLVTRVENPKDSPFQKLFESSARFLTREEVFSQSGAKEWAFEVHDKLQVEHDEISAFILGLTAA